MRTSSTQFRLDAVVVKFKSPDLFRWVGQFAEVLAASVLYCLIPALVFDETCCTHVTSHIVTGEWCILLLGYLKVNYAKRSASHLGLPQFTSEEHGTVWQPLRSSVDNPAVFSSVEFLVGWRTEVIECFLALLMWEQFLTDPWCWTIGLGKSSWKLATLFSASLWDRHIIDSWQLLNCTRLASWIWLLGYFGRLEWENLHGWKMDERSEYFLGSCNNNNPTRLHTSANTIPRLSFLCEGLKRFSNDGYTHLQEWIQVSVKRAFVIATAVI